MRLKNLGIFGMGQTILTKDMIDCGDPVYSATIEDKPLGYIQKEKNKINLKLNDFVIPARGASIGKITLIKDETATCTQTTMYMKPFSIVNSKFLFFLFKSIESYLFQSSGSAQPQITVNETIEKLIPIPPSNEQNSIYQKIIILNKSVDEYDELNINLINLDKIFKLNLKKSIIQYAIEGKLVKQDLNSETVSELVKKISEEKQKLISEGKIKKDKNESFIFEDNNCYYEKVSNFEPKKIDVPFGIPKTWHWIKLSNICELILGKTPKRSINTNWNSNDINWVTISDMKDLGKIFSTKEYITNEAFKNEFTRISKKESLLMSFKLTIGRTSILEIDAVHNEAIVTINPYYDKDYAIRDFLFYTLGTFVSFIEKTSAIKGSTINKEKMINMLVSLPPINEQRRIIKSISKIHSLINSIA
ncbi:restriction endonuclease subunit S [Malacoplasma penetrans]|nr:restriction endonuclease subunit S [Malacoplasma penetrans]